MSKFESLLFSCCKHTIDFIKAHKRNLLLVLLGLSYVFFAIAYIGFAAFYGSQNVGANIALAVIYYLGITAAYILIFIGVIKEKRFLVTIPLMALVGFVGTLCVSRFSNMFDPGHNNINACFNIFFFMFASFIDGLLLAIVILYVCGYLCKKKGCQKAIDILIFIGFGLSIIEFVLGCFFQGIFGYGWEYSVLYLGFVVFYFILMVFLNTNLIEDKYIVGVLYSVDPEKIVDAKVEEPAKEKAE